MAQETPQKPKADPKSETTTKQPTAQKPKNDGKRTEKKTRYTVVHN